MSHFYASIQGQAGPATRCGSVGSGITGHVRGWDVGVEVVGTVENGRDEFRVYATRGSNGGSYGLRQLVAIVREGEGFSFPEVVPAKRDTRFQAVGS